MALDPVSVDVRVTLPDSLAAEDHDFKKMVADETERRSHWRHFTGGTYEAEYESIHSALVAIERDDESRYDKARIVLDEFALWCKGHVRDSTVAFFAVMHPANRMVSREQLALDLFTWASEFGPLQV